MAEKLMKYADAVKKFDPVIGLETHVELSTTTKLFCPAEVSFGGDPNSQLTPVSLGLPGFSAGGQQDCSRLRHQAGSCPALRNCRVEPVRA